MLCQRRLLTIRANLSEAIARIRPTDPPVVAAAGPIGILLDVERL